MSLTLNQNTKINLQVRNVNLARNMTLDGGNSTLVQYPCIDGVKGDIYSLFCSTCSKKISCKHMEIGDVKRHIERAGHKKMATAKENQLKLAFVSSRDPIRKKVGTNFITKLAVGQFILCCLIRLNVLK